MFEFYKKGQGKWTRGLTMGGAALIVGLGADWLYHGPLGTLARAFNRTAAARWPCNSSGRCCWCWAGCIWGSG